MSRVDPNHSEGQTLEELRERAAGALAREWGITVQEARDALERVRKQERRLGREMHRERVWADVPGQREPVDLTRAERCDVLPSS